MTVTIEEVRVPERADEASWVAFQQLRQVALDETSGPGTRQVTPENALASELADPVFVTRRWLAWLGSQPVGTAELVVDTIDEPEGGFVTVFVAPEFRRLGIGRRLAERLRSDLGEATVRLSCEISTPPPGAGEPELTSPTGAGTIPADHPGVRLAQSYGFRLGQVGRLGHYDFTDPAVPLDQALAEARGVAQGYDVLCLEGVPAPELREDIAVLKMRMSTDEPAGQMPRILATWDATGSPPGR